MREARARQLQVGDDMSGPGQCCGPAHCDQVLPYAETDSGTAWLKRPKSLVTAVQAGSCSA